MGLFHKKMPKVKIEDIEVGGEPQFIEREMRAEKTTSVGEIHTFARLVSDDVGAALGPKLDALEQRLNDVEAKQKQQDSMRRIDDGVGDGEETEHVERDYSDVDVTAVTPEERVENDAIFARHVIDNDDYERQCIEMDSLQSQRLILLLSAYVCGLFVGVAVARLARR